MPIYFLFSLIGDACQPNPVIINSLRQMSLLFVNFLKIINSVKTMVNVYQMVTDLYVDVHQDSVVKDVKYVIHAHQIQ